MVTTYRCLENGTFALLQAYIDEDKDESFYTISWARDHVDDSPLLVAAGVHGTIRVINCATEKLAKSFVSHGKAINEIKTQALKPSLIISASKDESIRLWNIHTGICIMIFAGDGGHRGEVLSVDFHPVDINRFVSCSMDNTVKIWSMKVHNNYVDCTMWLGDFILSKSVENEILLWESSTNQINPTKGSIDILQKYPVPKCNLWFMKFSCDFHFSLLAIGNNEGKIYLWEVQSSPPSLITRLTNQQCKSPIRQTAVSYDGRIILGAGEDGNIWRWDEVDPPSSKNWGRSSRERSEWACRSILPLLLFMAKLGPGLGLGCEAAEGSLVPTRKREYKPCGKHTEGKRPLYAIGFNFMDARYYDVFATVGGNRVSFLNPCFLLACCYYYYSLVLFLNVLSVIVCSW
ncbi:hypothetical protein PR202_gb28870 [Eleusine coracana subsp. coracana]|uniref:Fertilization-independent endosperm protein n=1 Tax=Eleusine coracana subsp. coracana TaxID=191504 RepID=A0AAV5FVJ8_ELECO|nr:hypothetical protein PR202_gb28870 [Eleusine coracana subsp. coracana]